MEGKHQSNVYSEASSVVEALKMKDWNTSIGNDNSMYELLRVIKDKMSRLPQRLPKIAHPE